VKEMKKKILIGSVFAALLMVSMPFVSAFQAQSIPEENTSPNVVIPASPVNPRTMSLDRIVALLQYIADNWLTEYDEEFIQEFQNNIDILSAGPKHPLFCAALYATIISLYTLSSGPRPGFLKLRNYIIVPLIIILNVKYFWSCIVPTIFGRNSIPSGSTLTSHAGVTREIGATATSSGCRCIQ
jgi:hypothetical protein